MLQSTKNEKEKKHLYILPEKHFLALHNCYTLCIVKVRAKGVALQIHSMACCVVQVIHFTLLFSTN